MSCPECATAYDEGYTKGLMAAEERAARLAKVAGAYLNEYEGVYDSIRDGKKYQSATAKKAEADLRAALEEES